MSLTPKQARFVDEYLIDLNGTQAAIRAGYSKKTANEQAARLLANVSVAKAIVAAKAERAARTHLSQDRVLRELTAIAFCDIGSILEETQPPGNWRFKPVPAWPEATRRAVASIRSKHSGHDVGTQAGGSRSSEVVGVRFWGKLYALRLLSQHLGLFDSQHSPVVGPLREKQYFRFGDRVIEF